MFFSGYIAFILGGSSNVVELYSPEGKCQHKLANFPISTQHLTPMFWKGQVFVCGGFSNTKCFQYDIETDAWNAISSISTHDHSSFSGSSYQGKIYLASDQVR